MRAKDYLFTVMPRAPYYRGVQRGILPPINPLTLTFSVTAACQSRCRTCNIGAVYLANPALRRDNLSLDEVERTFRKLGPVYFLNLSGGEPFMRPDLAEIVRLGCIHLRPRLIHIPTNAIAPKQIEKVTRKILSYLEQYGRPDLSFSIKPSVDGVGTEHDRVRGYAGNFAALEDTLRRLLALKRENPRLHVDLGTVISNFNIDHLGEIEDWVHRQGIDSYRHEIAETRAEFHNLGDPITPSADVYERLIRGFQQKIRKHLPTKSPLTRMTESVRLVYYDVALQIIRQQRQVSPCLAGISNIHLNYNGELWPCCVLGSEKPLGNIRSVDYDIHAILRSPQAREVIDSIRAGECACPLANQWLNNILLTPRHMVRVLATYARSLVPRRKPF